MHDDEFDRDKFRKTLGRRIAKVRKSKGYSQDRLCLEAGFSRGTLSRIEAGEREPLASTIYRIADILGVSVSKLFEFKIY